MKNPGGILQDNSMPMKDPQKSARQSSQQANSYLDVEAASIGDKEVTVTAVWDKMTTRYDLEGAVKSQQQNLSIFSTVISQILPLEKEAYWNHHQLDIAICSFELKRLLRRSLRSFSDLPHRSADRLEQQVLGLLNHHRSVACLVGLFSHLHYEATIHFQTKKGCVAERERLPCDRQS